jgi:hypothetical protein
MSESFFFLIFVPLLRGTFKSTRSITFLPDMLPISFTDFINYFAAFIISPNFLILRLSRPTKSPSAPPSNKNDFKTEQEEYKKMKEKLNGDIIMKLIPQLKGKELGNFIYKLENSFGSKENLYSFVFQNNQDNIDKYILDFYNTL